MKEFNSKINDFVIGQVIPSSKVKIDKKTYKSYNRLIGEINPIHLSKKYAQNLGFDDIVVAGNYLFSIINKWIVDWIKDVKIFKKISIKFENPVYPDDEIMFLGTISNIDNSGIEKIIICNYQGKKSKDIEVMNGTIELKIISND
jgi:acyl dehydratase